MGCVRFVSLLRGVSALGKIAWGACVWGGPVVCDGAGFRLILGCFLMSSVMGCEGFKGCAYLSTIQYSFLCSFTMVKSINNPQQGQNPSQNWADFGFSPCDYVNDRYVVRICQRYLTR